MKQLSVFRLFTARNIRQLIFYDINSPKKGFGGKIVDAVFKDFSEDWQPAVVMDWSNGFWDRMKEKHKKHEWIM